MKFVLWAIAAVVIGLIVAVIYFVIRLGLDKAEGKNPFL